MVRSLYRPGDTLGTQLLATWQEHIKSPPIEVGELSHEGGKSYMRELVDCIEANKWRAGNYYILAACTKPPPSIGQNRVIIFCFGAIQGPPKYQPDMRPSFDCWLVNNETANLKLQWSLPDYEDMPKFLAEPYDHDRQLIDWIKKYEKIQASRRKSKS